MLQASSKMQTKSCDVAGFLHVPAVLRLELEAADLVLLSANGSSGCQRPSQLAEGLSL